MDIDSTNNEKDKSYEFQILESIISDNKNKKKENVKKNIKEKFIAGLEEEIKENDEIKENEEIKENDEIEEKVGKKEKEENEIGDEFSGRMNSLLKKLNTQLDNVKNYVYPKKQLSNKELNLKKQKYNILNENNENMNNQRKNKFMEKDKNISKRFNSNDVKINNYIINVRYDNVDNNIDESNNINEEFDENRHDDMYNNGYNNIKNNSNIDNNRILNINNNNYYNNPMNHNNISCNDMNIRGNKYSINMLNNNVNYDNRINRMNNINIINMKKSWDFNPMKNNNIYNNNDINLNMNYNMRNSQGDLQFFEFMANMYNASKVMNNNMNNNFMNYNNNYNNSNLNFSKIDKNKNIDIPNLNVGIVFNEKKLNIIINQERTIRDLIYAISFKISEVDIRLCKFLFNSKDLNLMNKSLKLLEVGIADQSKITIVNKNEVRGGSILVKQINIHFIKLLKQKKNIRNKNTSELCGLLKLYFLKELSEKLDIIHINKLPLYISSIMEILKNGDIKSSNAKESIKEILKKIEGSNIINFSRYVDKTIDSKNIEEMCLFLNEKDLDDINETKNLLEKYNEHIKLFENEFENAKKNSIFEFSIISLVIVEREDFETFQKGRNKCPNRINKILYHGTSIDPISNILTDVFKKSENRCYQHGKGVYFTDVIDYCWFYGSPKGNRDNCNKIPKIKDTFTLIASSVYYNQKGFKRVYNSNYTPKKNEINFAYAGANFETIRSEKVDESKFYGTEYVIYDLNQICPFIGAKLQRDEFCVIWRDPNFSKDPVYNNDYDEKFKQFLKDRIIYIEQLARFNIYPFETSEEALKLIKRKKYNKIILISNIGDDKSGKKFIEDARKILKSEVIALFLSYNKSHLNWVKNFKNALFSNEPKFYESYLECFAKKHDFQIILSLKKLRESIEEHYHIKFKFDQNFLKYPLFKDSGQYSDLTFN